MKFSVVIPAYNESESIGQTVETVVAALRREGIEFEILVVDDHSTDDTSRVVAEIAKSEPNVVCVENQYKNGFGNAVRFGLDNFSGDAVAIMMADCSDDPEDLVTYYRLLQEGNDCVFGSRFVKGGQVYDYPRTKLVVNRLVNFGIRLMFGHSYNDTTNAFKAYRREVIESVQPLLSHHFNLTVEIPLKAVVRGHSYAITPISWTNRQHGVSKLRLQEMGSRYAYVILVVFLEYHLTQGDYQRSDIESRNRGRWRVARPEHKYRK